MSLASFQKLDLHGPLACGATVWFASPDALKGSLVNTLQEVRPTMFLGVPRVWEKIQDKMELQLKEMKGFKRALCKWAQKIGSDAGEAKQQSGELPRGYWMADRLVFHKIKETLGLDRCILQASAAAPITQETIEFFQSLDIPVYEIYGMSECTGPQTLSFDGQHRSGSAGKSIPGSEIKIGNPDRDGNGEICFRGRHIFMGYMHNESRTNEAIDSDGWLHSGDVGKLDKNGFLCITGRIKELIITAGGENIAPIPIEDKIKQCAPIVSNCMVVGDKKKFLSLVCTLRCTFDELEPTDELDWVALDQCKKNRSTALTVTEALLDPLVLNHIKRAVQETNKCAVSNAAKIQKFRVLPVDFSIPGGELGATLKLRRQIVMSKYKDVIDEMYDDVAPIPLKLPEQCQSQVPTMNHAPPPSLEESPSLNVGRGSCLASSRTMYHGLHTTPSPSLTPSSLTPASSYMHYIPPPITSKLKKDASSGSDEELIAKHLDELSMHVEHQLNINQTSTSAPPPDLLPLQGLQTQL